MLNLPKLEQAKGVTVFHCKCNRQTYIKGDWCCIIEQKKALALKMKDKRELEALYQRCGSPKEQAQTTVTNR